MNPLWAKAPLNLVLRFPKVGLAAAGAAALLGIVAIAGPLFISTSGSAALQDQLAQNFPYFLGPGFTTFGPLDGDSQDELEAMRTTLDDTVGGEEHLGEQVFGLLGPQRSVFAEGTDERSEIRLLYRDRAIEMVNIIEGDGSGALVADSVAETLGGISPGDEIVVAGMTLKVSGIYEALATADQVDEYWFPLAGAIFTDNTGFTPPAFLILPEDTFMSIARNVEINAQRRIEYPLIYEGLTLPEARELAGYMRALHLAINEGAEYEDRFVEEPADVFAEGGVFRSGLPDEVQDADETVTALQGPVLVLTLAGAVVALAVMAAAGAYVIAARRNESVLLTARGMSAVSQGTRAVVEALVPSLLGAAVGAGIGYALILSIGPSDLLPPGAYGSAAFQLGVVLSLGLVVLGTAAMISARSLTQAVGQRRRFHFGRVWWEIPVLLLAAGAFFEITTQDSVVISSESGDRIDIFMLLFPILFLIAAAGLIGRALRIGFGRLRDLGTAWSPPAYLASRRLAGAPGSIVALLVAAVLAVGILVYAQSLAASIEASTRAKAGVFVGSDVTLQVYPNAEVPSDFPYPATKIRLIPELEMATGQEVALLGVDRETFARAAFWDESFSSRSLDDLMEAIEPQPGAPLRVVNVGVQTGSSPALSLSQEIPLNLVATADAFPGLTAGSGLLVADNDAIGDALTGISTAVLANAEDEIWVKGDPTEVLQAAQGRFEIGIARNIQQVLDLPSLQSLTWTFDLLRALGLAAGGVALVALLLYLQARQRSTIVSYALARRMGLGRVQHGLALILELAVLVASAVVSGTLLASAASRLLYLKMDLLPDIPPDPLLRIPVVPILLLVGAALMAVGLGAVLVQRGADKARIAEVLRLAE